VSAAPLGGALLRYRVMAYVVGVGLIILVCVGVPLQYAANSPGVVAVVGPIHGALYVVYLVAAADLARRARFGLLQLAAMVAAGFVPFVAFVVERHVVHRLAHDRAENGTGVAGD
jgi:integral membrane protein